MGSDPRLEYEVTPGCVEVAGALLRLAEKHGWNCTPTIDREGNADKDLRCLILKPGTNKIGWNKQSVPDGYELISVEQAVEVLQQQKRLRIGEHLVEFHGDHILVACVKVSVGTVDEIYDRLHRKAEQ